MTEVTVEAAAFADAIAKVARVTPNKGAAFDKAQGIILDVRPNGKSPLNVRATDLESAFFRKLPHALATGTDPVTWRLPSELLQGIAANLPLGPGKTVTLFDEDNFIHFHVGRSKAKLRPIDPHESYPIDVSKPFAANALASVPGFAARVQQVAWACHDEPERAPLCGVHIDGTHLYGCDLIKLALVPCTVPVADPITVPLRTLVSLLKDASGDVKVQATGDRLRMMIDADTQLSTTIFHSDYPKVRNVIRDDFAGEAKVSASELVDAVNSMMVLVRGQRYPALRLAFRKGELHFGLTMKELGSMENVVDAECDEDFDCAITPTNLTNALTPIGEGMAHIAFGPDPKRTIRFTDGKGYECHSMPIVVS